MKEDVGENMGQNLTLDDAKWKWVKETNGVAKVCA